MAQATHKVSLVHPRRYQLTKEAARIVASGHPWIFRSHLSSACDIFADGQWLKLVDAHNEVLGFGLFEKEGLIGIRVLKRGKNAPTLAWLSTQIDRALEKRVSLLKYTNAFRAIHGENDGFPGVVVDVYRDVGVLQTYSIAADLLGRYVIQLLTKKLDLQHVYWKIPAKRVGKATKRSSRWLRGGAPGPLAVHEGKLRITVDIGEGQKSGTFLDLRGLRKWLSLQKMTGKRVLNLFSYTGTLGLAAEMGGASEIWNVDVSKGALEFARKYHTLNRKHYRFVAADIFDWLRSLAPSEKFDVIIVDPPSMTSQVSQVPRAIKAYRELYRAALSHLAHRGILLACCCTSRISRKQFREVVDSSVRKQLKFMTTIQPEDDHPVSFSEGDYLKLLVYRF